MCTQPGHLTITVAGSPVCLDCDTERNTRAMTAYCSILPNVDHSVCPSSVECSIVTVADVQRAERYHSSMAFGR